VWPPDAFRRPRSFLGDAPLFDHEILVTQLYTGQVTVAPGAKAFALLSVEAGSQ
jgi:hypothetical protein